MGIQSAQSADIPPGKCKTSLHKHSTAVYAFVIMYASHVVGSQNLSCSPFTCQLRVFKLLNYCVIYSLYLATLCRDTRIEGFVQYCGHSESAVKFTAAYCAAVHSFNEAHSGTRKVMIVAACKSCVHPALLVTTPRQQDVQQPCLLV